ncbi:GIY-YIG nuclease family protein [Sphingomonas sp.]|uniref:GIY-YIG nuclease family protein n=1 Tax=Sphingomonas sp. TaxID=28214 RepID=UPI003B3BE8B2
MKPGYVYIMTNRPNGTLYIGVTADIAARVTQHRSGTGADFCKRYDLTQLVHVEPYPTIQEAIAREKAMKAWQCSWKLKLISSANPDWDDLYLTLNT